ncbi:MAG: DEAD/DEAH box helicase family protein [Lentisphaeria bacterium]|nr:DEAD/DEAH box helicase family protein [Lentisphaeria bacterium]
MPKATAERGKKSTAKTGTPHKFANKLLLNQWLISLFGIDPLVEQRVNGKVVRPFHRLAENLRNAPEGLDADQHHKFYNILRTEDFFRWDSCVLTLDELKNYEENIIAHTEFINQKRKTPIQWKYFQWMALLFTEIYLDRYFRNREQLLADLNDFVERFNAKYSEYTPVSPYTLESLNKVCLQNATGSGKTLLMHVNVQQFKHYVLQYGQDSDLNFTYLLTPNERLSNQHINELAESSLWGMPYQKNNLPGKDSVVLLEIQKLQETEGPNTVAARSLGSNNLLLVDEGHAGLSGKDAKKEQNAWYKYRSMLCEKGFSFEYSATFSQAVSGTDHEDDYAKSILFDYSYGWFYADGYGKDYQIFNIPAPKTQKGGKETFSLLNTDEKIQFTYLTGALLKFYQQLLLYQDKYAEFHDFNIEKPLWVFVGSTVSGGASADDKEVTTDIIRIISFFAGFLANREQAEETMEALIFRTGQDTGLLDTDNRDFFHGAFAYLAQSYSGENGKTALYADILKEVFHTGAGGKLVLERVKGNSGEIILRVGLSTTPCGLINISDAKKLCDLLAASSIGKAVDFADSNDYTQAMFETVKNSSSPINLLIGAKKFVEGWDCWRVSTFGLMHVGKSEGAQIIQLFGRGVRLKGYGHSLKRSGYSKASVHPRFIEELEQLNVFGIEADFMQKFHDYLKEEGLPGNERKHIEKIPLNVTYDFGKKLKVLRPKRKNGNGSEYSFKKDGPVPQIGELPNYLIENKIVLDWYPRIQSELSRQINAGELKPNKESFSKPLLDLLDYQRMFFALERFKRQQSWYNLNITIEGIRKILANDSWYELFIPKERMTPSCYADVEVLQRIATELLKRYAEKLYGFENRKFIEPRLEYRELTKEDTNFPDMKDYQFTVDADDTTLIESIRKLQQELSTKRDQLVSIGGIDGINPHIHLFQPLFHVKASGQITVMPVSLNDSEFQFVQDLTEYCKKSQGANGEVFLLRNLSSAKGIGFIEASGFHPDFILWNLIGGKQYITFIEPHGLLHEQEDSDKIRFAERVKEIQNRLGDANVILNSFILSWTKYSELPWRSHQKKEELEHRHVLFMKDTEDYVSTMFTLLQEKAKRSEHRKKDRNTYQHKLIAALLEQNPNQTLSLEDLVSTWSILKEPNAIGDALQDNETVQDWVRRYPDALEDKDDLMIALLHMIDRHEISVSKDLHVHLLNDPEPSQDIRMDAEFAWLAIQSIRANAPQIPESPIIRFVQAFETFKTTHPDFIKAAHAGEYAHAA